MPHQYIFNRKQCGSYSHSVYFSWAYFYYMVSPWEWVLTLHFNIWFLPVRRTEAALLFSKEKHYRIGTELVCVCIDGWMILSRVRFSRILPIFVLLSDCSICWWHKHKAVSMLISIYLIPSIHFAGSSILLLSSTDYSLYMQNRN